MDPNVLGTPLLRIEGVSKSFGGLHANDGISLDVKSGEVHVILGENGAGKTTLMNILYGLYHPDSGRILWDGREVRISSPREALDLGIGMVHQHFMLVPTLTVLDNLLLMLPNTGQFPNRGKLTMSLRDLAQRFNLDIDPAARVSTLSLGERQRVEILKALSRDVRLLILDEPTSVLTPQEVDALWKTLARLRGEGLGVLLITHKLTEARAITDQITVLRRGTVVKSWRSDDVTDTELIDAIIGGVSIVDTAGEQQGPHRTEGGSQPVMELQAVSTRGDHANLQDFDLALFAGEVLGIAGVDGNGQTALARVAACIQAPESGRIRFRDPSPRIGFVPANRLGTGLVATFTVTENMLLRNFSSETWFGASRLRTIRWRAVRAMARGVIQDFSVKARVGQEVRELSGGNQQKLVVGREIGRGIDVLVVEQPTQGLDVSASASIIRMMKQLAHEEGKPVLWISSNLDELLTHADRIAVLYRGRIAGEVLPGQDSLVQAGRLMMGIR